MKSALRQAIFENRLDLVAVLVAQRPELLNLADSDGYTPLSDALFYNNVQALEILHDAGVDYAKGWDGKSPLYWALLYSEANILCFLLNVPKLELDIDCKRFVNGLKAGKDKTQMIVEELAGF